MPWKIDNRWRLNGENQTLKQVWFPGIHSDIGGGYKESDLSDISLNWMAKEAIANGLLIDGTIIRKDTNPDNAKIHVAWDVANKICGWVNYLPSMLTDKKLIEVTEYETRGAMNGIYYGPLHKDYTPRDTWKPDKDRTSEQVRLEFWRNIGFDDSALVWIFDRMTGIKSYQFFEQMFFEKSKNNITELSKKADEEAYKLIIWMVEKALETQKQLPERILSILKKAVIIKEHQFAYPTLNDHPVTQKLDSVINSIVYSYNIVIDDNSLNNASQILLDNDDKNMKELKQYISELRMKDDLNWKNYFAKWDKIMPEGKTEATRNPVGGLIIEDEWLIVDGIRL